jgi:tRNA (cmo5U34)-methyltransferase
MSDDVWNPETYLEQMSDEVPGYAELEDAVAAATEGLELRRVLELGTGTGETALRILAKHPAAGWVGIDASEAMLARARGRLPRADLRRQRLEDPLPDGPFDLVVSALAIHHLDATAKRTLFTRVARLSNVFVLGDVVVPERSEDAAIEIDWAYDLPSSVADQRRWLLEAGFDETAATFVRPDLAVIVATRRLR